MKNYTKSLLGLALLAGSVMHAYNPQALKQFSETGNGKNLDLRKADLRKIIENPGMFYAINKKTSIFRTLFGLRPPAKPFNLSGAQLDGANMSGLDLTTVNLDGASCKNTDFSNSRFSHVTLTKGRYCAIGGTHASIKGTDLKTAIVKNAFFNIHQITRHFADRSKGSCIGNISHGRSEIEKARKDSIEEHGHEPEISFWWGNTIPQLEKIRAEKGILVEPVDRHST